MLLAWLSESGDDVHQAIFSSSPFLAWIYHTSLINEIVCAAVESSLRAGESPQETMEVMRRYRELGHADNAPGYITLLQRSAAK